MIGGYTRARGRAQGIGALLLGVHDGRHAALRRQGRHRASSTQTLRDLHARLAARSTQRRLAVRARRPRPSRRRTGWSRELVGEVAFTEWTRDGGCATRRSRACARTSRPREVVRERRQRRRVAAASAEAAIERRRPIASRACELTHPDRVLYPEHGVTKRDLAQYYEAIADWILPHSRPARSRSCAARKGVGKKCFYQKHPAPARRDRSRRVRIQERTAGRRLPGGRRPARADRAGADRRARDPHLERGRRPARAARPRSCSTSIPTRDVRWARVVEAARAGARRVLEARPRELRQDHRRQGPARRRRRSAPARPGTTVRRSPQAVAERIARERARRATPPRCRRPRARARSSSTTCATRAAPPRCRRLLHARATGARRSRCRSPGTSWRRSCRSDHYTVANLPRRLGRPARRSLGALLDLASGSALTSPPREPEARR